MQILELPQLKVLLSVDHKKAFFTAKAAMAHSFVILSFRRETNKTSNRDNVMLCAQYTKKICSSFFYPICVGKVKYERRIFSEFILWVLLAALLHSMPSES